MFTSSRKSDFNQQGKHWENAQFNYDGTVHSVDLNGASEVENAFA